MEQAVKILSVKDTATSAEEITKVALIVYGAGMVVDGDCDPGECVWGLATNMANVHGERWRSEMLGSSRMESR